MKGSIGTCVQLMHGVYKGHGRNVGAMDKQERSG